MSAGTRGVWKGGAPNGNDPARRAGDGNAIKGSRDETEENQ